MRDLVGGGVVVVAHLRRLGALLKVLLAPIIQPILLVVFREETFTYEELRRQPQAEVVERRTYEVYEGNDTLPKPSALFDPAKAAPFTNFVSIDIKS